MIMSHFPFESAQAYAFKISLPLWNPKIPDFWKRTSISFSGALLKCKLLVKSLFHDDTGDGANISLDSDHTADEIDFNQDGQAYPIDSGLLALEAAGFESKDNDDFESDLELAALRNSSPDDETAEDSASSEPADSTENNVVVPGMKKV